MGNKVKIQSLRKVLEMAQADKSILQIDHFKGSFIALLLKKNFFDSLLSSIEVQALENNNPEYAKGTSHLINMDDNGLIEIKIL